MSSGTQPPLDGTADYNTQSPISLPHLQRDLALIQRYAAIYSETPYTSRVPLFGPIIVLFKNIARRLLRRTAAAGLGTQAEFNSAVAHILFEFTRRATTAGPLALNGSAIEEAWLRVANAKPSSNQSAAMTELLHDFKVLLDKVYAAQMSASQAEQDVAVLRREVARLQLELKNRQPLVPTDY